MNSPLEQYLDTLHRYLRLVPSQWRDDQIAEVRQHLMAHADELTAEGMTPYAAEEEAIRHFGKASQTARSLIAAWWRQLLPLDVHTRKTALLAAVGLAGTGLAQSAIIPLLNLYLPQPMRVPLGPGIDSLSLLTLIYWFVVGAMAGAQGKRRVLMSTLWGGVAGTVAAQLIGRLQAAMWMSNPQGGPQMEAAMARAAQGSVNVIHVASLHQFSWIICAFAMLCLGATFTTRQQRLRRVVN